MGRVGTKHREGWSAAAERICGQQGLSEEDFVGEWAAWEQSTGKDGAQRLNASADNKTASAASAEVS